jgi:hypothetical protein
VRQLGWQGLQKFRESRTNPSPQPPQVRFVADSPPASRLQLEQLVALAKQVRQFGLHGRHWVWSRLTYLPCGQAEQVLVGGSK